MVGLESTGPDPTSLNEELGQLSGMSMAGSSWAGSSREPDEDPAALAEEERLVAMVEDRLRRRPALHRRLQTAVLGALHEEEEGAPIEGMRMLDAFWYPGQRRWAALGVEGPLPAPCPAHEDPGE